MAEIVLKRTGNISRRRTSGHFYWEGCISVDKVRMKKVSKHREVVEAWLAEILREHPTYVFRTNREKAVKTYRRRGGRQARHVIVSETDPMTATRFFSYKTGVCQPEKVIIYDYINDIPLVWIADDNGERGFTLKKAAERAAAMPRTMGILHTTRPMDGLKTIRTWDR